MGKRHRSARASPPCSTLRAPVRVSNSPLPKVTGEKGDFIMVGENGCEQYSGRSVVRNINASRARPRGTVPTHLSIRRHKRRAGIQGTCCGTSSHEEPFETEIGRRKPVVFKPRLDLSQNNTNETAPWPRTST